MGLYPDSILKMYEDAGSLPDDLVEITDEQYEEFAGASPDGKQIGADEDGMPCWVDFHTTNEDRLPEEGAGN